MIKGLYTAPMGTDILGCVAHALHTQTGGDMETLRKATILLPTRRAIRTIEDILLSSFGGKTVLLPMLAAIGDIELPTPEDEKDRPPPRSIGGVERLYSLLPFLEKHGLGGGRFEAAWQMAQHVAKLIDLLQTEDLTPHNLDAIAPDTQAQHWQDNVGAFQRVANDWLAHLHDTQRINSAAGRTLRIERLIEQWEKEPPVDPVWLIGSTGSIAVVRRLMRATLNLPQGVVFLPGLDMGMDDGSWGSFSDAHPQALLRTTLNALGYDRREVKMWPGCTPDDVVTDRAAWLSNALSPHPKIMAPHAPERIALCTPATLHEEAEIIAHICARAYAEKPDPSLVVVANDPGMAARLSPILTAQGIELDASAGLVLEQTGYGVRLAGLLRLFSPAADITGLWSLLKQRGFAPFWTMESREPILTNIDRTTLRNALQRPDTIEDLLPLLPPSFTDAFTQTRTRLSASRPLPDWARAWIEILPQYLPARTPHDKACLDAALEVLEQLATLRLTGSVSAYEAELVLCEQLMRAPCRPQPRGKRIVHILGTMEARLIRADIAILAGLNEGAWPDTPQPNPFVSRAMRHATGLPDTERQAALSGHDFQQAFMAPHIYITRSSRNAEGPALPARWLQRLKAVTPKDIWQAMETRGNAVLSDYHARHRPAAVTPFGQPAPHGNTLPDPLSVTAVELWRADPYAFWARHIARLKKLDPFLPEIDASTRGTVWHDIFKIFVETFDPAATLTQQIDGFSVAVSTVLDQHNLPTHRRRLWQARLDGLAQSLVMAERERRFEAQPHALEEDWTREVEGVSLFARADRVDKHNNGALILCDYKTGEMPSVTAVRQGLSCQLSLLALILGQPVERLEYIEIKGGRNAPAQRAIEWDEVFALETREGFRAWVALFMEQVQRFVSLADHGGVHGKKGQDYRHLARHQEWGVES